jgi:hypothetical protein
LVTANPTVTDLQVNHQSAIYPIPYISCISPLYPSYHTVTTPDVRWDGLYRVETEVYLVVQTLGSALRQHQVSDRVTTTNNHPLLYLYLSHSLLSHQLPSSYSTVTTNPHSFNPFIPIRLLKRIPRYLSLNVTQTPPLSIRYKQQSHIHPIRKFTLLVVFTILHIVQSTTNSTDSNSSDTFVEPSTPAVRQHHTLQPHIISYTLFCLVIRS